MIIVAAAQYLASWCTSTLDNNVQVELSYSDYTISVLDLK